MHIDEILSVSLSVGVREILDCTYCFRVSRLVSNLSFQREYVLLQLRNILFNRHRHRSSSERSSANAPPAFSAIQPANAFHEPPIAQIRTTRDGNCHQHSAPPEEFPRNRTLRNFDSRCATNNHATMLMKLTLCHMPWILFLEPLRSARVCDW